MFACYRIHICSKKWWWPLFAWSLNAITVNAWRIFQNTKHTSMSLFTFTREVACHSKTSEPQISVGLLVVTVTVVRRDHYPVILGKTWWGLCPLQAPDESSLREMQCRPSHFLLQELPYARMHWFSSPCSSQNTHEHSPTTIVVHCLKLLILLKKYTLFASLIAFDLWLILCILY